MPTLRVSGKHKVRDVTLFHDDGNALLNWHCKSPEDGDRLVQRIIESWDQPLTVIKAEKSPARR